MLYILQTNQHTILAYINRFAYWKKVGARITRRARQYSGTRVALIYLANLIYLAVGVYNYKLPVIPSDERTAVLYDSCADN